MMAIDSQTSVLAPSHNLSHYADARGDRQFDVAPGSAGNLPISRRPSLQRRSARAAPSTPSHRFFLLHRAARDISADLARDLLPKVGGGESFAARVRLLPLLQPAEEYRYMIA